MLGPIIGIFAMVGLLNFGFPPRAVQHTEFREATLVAGLYFMFGFIIGGPPAAMTGAVIAWLRLEPRVATLPLAALIGAVATIAFFLLSSLTAGHAPKSFDWENFKSMLLFTGIGAFAAAICWLALIGQAWKVQRAALQRPDARSEGR